MISQPKKLPFRSAKYLAFIRAMPCETCQSRYAIQVHHESTDGGTMGGKTSDENTLALCIRCHLDRHNMGRKSFWKSFNIDPVTIIKRNLAAYNLTKMKGKGGGKCGVGPY
jgi:hypothetical protein